MCERYKNFIFFSLCFYSKQVVHLLSQSCDRCCGSSVYQYLGKASFNSSNCDSQNITGPNWKHGCAKVCKDMGCPAAGLIEMSQDTGTCCLFSLDNEDYKFIAKMGNNSAYIR